MKWSKTTLCMGGGGFRARVLSISCGFFGPIMCPFPCTIYCCDRGLKKPTNKIETASTHDV